MEFKIIFVAEFKLFQILEVKTHHLKVLLINLKWIK